MKSSLAQIVTPSRVVPPSSHPSKLRGAPAFPPTSGTGRKRLVSTSCPLVIQAAAARATQTAQGAFRLPAILQAMVLERHNSQRRHAGRLPLQCPASLRSTQPRPKHAQSRSGKWEACRGARRARRLRRDHRGRADTQRGAPARPEAGRAGRRRPAARTEGGRRRRRGRGRGGGGGGGGGGGARGQGQPGAKPGAHRARRRAEKVSPSEKVSISPPRRICRPPACTSPPLTTAARHAQDGRLHPPTRRPGTAVLPRH